MADLLEQLKAALADRYAIERELGAGGMATVYLAHDVKHDRKVALKVLRPELAAVLGAERFVQEIKTTANLQHPHILPLFDSGEADGFLYYVMPFIDGETLRDKLNRETQLGIDEAVRIACDIADALDYAHRQNVIHRDIKPENILIHDGRPMVVDFGIALAVSAAAGGRMTETGLSLGTPHYMSPEQATADKDLTNRSDIYSLGSVLYEMLAGEPPHTGASAQAIVMKIVAEEVQPVTELRKSVPPHVAAATAKSLEKLPADRFESAAKFAEALLNPAFALPTTRAVAAGVTAADWRQRVAVPLAALALVLSSVALWGWLRPAPSPGLHRQRIELRGMPSSLGAIMQAGVAPDGSAIAYVAGFIGGTGGQLWIKERGATDPTPLTGVNDALTVSFSPDGEWLLYGTQAALRRVPRFGGASALVSDSGGGFGGAWLDDDTVVFPSKTFQRVYRVAAQGGEAELLLDVAEGTEGSAVGVGRVTPVWGADAVLLWGVSEGGVDQVWTLDLTTREVKVLFAEGATGAWSLATGHLVYGRSDGTVFVVPFDPRSLQMIGLGAPLVEGVSNAIGAMDLVISPNGTALYREGESTFGAGTFQPVWLSEDGSARRIPGEPNVLAPVTGGHTIAPDGQRLAYTATDDQGRMDVWIQSLTDQRPPTRLTFEGQINRRPTWTPDGESVVFISDRGGGQQAVWIRRADGRDRAQLLLTRDRAIFEALISPDGKWLVYRTDDDAAAGNGDILALRLESDSTEISVAVTEEQETSPALSPDGKWLAYAKGDEGQKQIHVVPFPEVSSGGPYQLTTSGGSEPVWAHNGRELFFRGPDGLVVVEVVTEAGFAQVGQRTLFELGGEYLFNFDHRLYGVGANDREFLFFRSAVVEANVGSIVLVENWLEEIDRLLEN